MRAFVPVSVSWWLGNALFGGEGSFRVPTDIPGAWNTGGAPGMLLESGESSSIARYFLCSKGPGKLLGTRNTGQAPA